jgi:hypothetical protein
VSHLALSAQQALAADGAIACLNLKADGETQQALAADSVET